MRGPAQKQSLLAPSEQHIAGNCPSSIPAHSLMPAQFTASPRGPYPTIVPAFLGKVQFLLTLLFPIRPWGSR